jgi:hypothetical protein
MRWLAGACILFLLLMFAGTANAIDLGETTRHFHITYKTSSAHKADDAVLHDTLERAYDHVNGYFGTCPDHIEVIIVDDAEMDKVGGQVDSLSAWNQLVSAIFLRRGTLKNNTSLPVFIEHEITHLAINDILCKKDPGDFRWMEEGVCMVVSKEPLSDIDVSKDIVARGFLNTREIAEAVKDENCSISRNGYMQSYSLVRYIVRRYGMDAVIKMMECPEASLDKAFRQCTGEDFPAFYKEWENYVTATAVSRLKIK